MKRNFFLRAVMAVLIVIVSGCYEEPLENRSGADCGGCEEPGDNGEIAPVCKIADGVIRNLVITHIGKRSFDYSFTVRNIGSSSLYLDRMQFDAYFSKNKVLDSHDVHAGGSIFGAAPALNYGEEYTKAWHADATTYKCLIIKISVRPGFSMPECFTSNNLAAQVIALDIPRNGLVAFYPFNGNANDESGNNSHATVSGATPATDRYGNPTQAYQFDGVNDFITAGNPPQLQISNTITVSGWMSVHSFGPTVFGRPIMTVVSKLFFNPNPSKGYHLGVSTDGFASPYYETLIYSSAPDGTPTSYLPAGVGGTPALHHWVFFSLVIDGMTMRYYQDGVLTNQITRPVTLLDDGTLGDLKIGTYGIGGFYFNGQMDDIAIYNRALSDTEIQQLFNQTISK